MFLFLVNALMFNWFIRNVGNISTSFIHSRKSLLQFWSFCVLIYRVHRLHFLAELRYLKCLTRQFFCMKSLNIGTFFFSALLFNTPFDNLYKFLMVDLGSNVQKLWGGMQNSINRSTGAPIDPP